MSGGAAIVDGATFELSDLWHLHTGPTMHWQQLGDGFARMGMQPLQNTHSVSRRPALLAELRTFAWWCAQQCPRHLLAAMRPRIFRVLRDWLCK